MKNIAIILAAGQGTRCVIGEHKQFLQIRGRSILSYSLETFQKNPNIDGIIVVTLITHLNTVKGICDRHNISKLMHIIPGGKERYLSTYAALKIINYPCNVLIHDSARPFISSYTIDECINYLKTYSALSVAQTLKESLAYKKDNEILHIPDRAEYLSLQTPQCFDKDLLLSAYEKFLNSDHKTVTDDCGVLLRCYPDLRVGFVVGNYQNIKITYPEDLSIAEFLYDN
jgi:2-C-methyl-D-erythritol 4-phosphate cytidylyltransferase